MKRWIPLVAAVAIAVFVGWLALRRESAPVTAEDASGSSGPAPGLAAHPKPLAGTMTLDRRASTQIVGAVSRAGSASARSYPFTQTT